MHNSPDGFRSSVPLALCLLALHSLAPVTRALDPAPTAVQSPQQSPSVRITFLPPPLDGTLSLAVFDRSGKRVRGRFKLLEFAEKRPGQWQQTNEFTVEIEGENKPAMIAEWITQVFV